MKGPFISWAVVFVPSATRPFELGWPCIMGATRDSVRVAHIILQFRPSCSCRVIAASIWTGLMADGCWTLIPRTGACQCIRCYMICCCVCRNLAAQAILRYRVPACLAADDIVVGFEVPVKRMQGDRSTDNSKTTGSCSLCTKGLVVQIRDIRLIVCQTKSWLELWWSRLKLACTSLRGSRESQPSLRSSRSPAVRPRLT